MKRTCRSLFAVLVAAVASFGASCATWYDLRYVPSPLEVELADSSGTALAGRALVSVLGVRRPKDGQPARFELALRLENLGTAPFALDPTSLELLSADLQPLGVAQLEPEVVPAVDPGATQNAVLFFAVPAEHSLRDYNVAGLNLRFAVTQAGRRVVVGASFQRALRPEYGYYVDPFYSGWHGYRHVGIGVGRFCAY